VGADRIGDRAQRAVSRASPYGTVGADRIGDPAQRASVE